VTIQFPQVEAKDLRLLSDSYTQRSSDPSFEEKLRFEQARLGPFSHLESLFNSQIGLDFASQQSLGSQKTESASDIYSTIEQIKMKATETGEFSKPSSSNPQTSTRMFESVSLQPFSRQLLQELLSKTNWLVPNLEANPLFFQASVDGKLQARLDLQALIDKIVEQATLVKSKGKTELSIALNPEELGEILLTTTYHAGVISIQINANPETKKLIDSQREELERALKKARVNFDQIKIQEVKKHA
jgi:flagellar hook-length control protein FliK